MGKIATTVDEQLTKLKDRGVIIEDEEKAKEILLDIGYYRLGFYFFPFEVTFPSIKNRDHKIKEGTRFSDAYMLYYFDFDLRNILLRYLSRVEVSIRTYLTYYISNQHKTSPTWFADPNVVQQSYIQEFDKRVYTDSFKQNSAIKGHHHKYPLDKYAPAWKTIEYMTFGEVTRLYDNLLDASDRQAIAQHFGVNQETIFSRYLETLRVLRNACAHGSQLFRIAFSKNAVNGPAGKFDSAQKSHLYAGISILQYVLHHISTEREKDMTEAITATYLKLNDNAPHLVEMVVRLSKYQPEDMKKIQK